MTDGMKTSEFALTVLILLIVAANKPLGLELDGAQLISLTGLGVGYAGSRGVAKITK